MKAVMTVFILLYGHIYQQYVDKDEDSETASLLTSIQITTLFLLNLMSLSFFFSPFVDIGGALLWEVPKYKLILVAAVLMGAAAMLIHKYFDWGKSFKARYFKMLDTERFQAEHKAAKSVPYITMLLFASSITFAIVYG